MPAGLMRAAGRIRSSRVFVAFLISLSDRAISGTNGAGCGLVEKLDENRGAGTLGFCVAKFCCMIFLFSRGVSVWWVFWVFFRVWGLYWAVKGFEDFPRKRLGLRVVSDGLEIAGLD